MLRVFFTGSLKEYRKRRALYIEIINFIKQQGGILTWDVVQTTDKRLREGKTKLEIPEWRLVYNQMYEALSNSDICIFENTTSAFSTGYLAGIALSKKIPVLLLMEEGSHHTFKTSFAHGILNPYLVIGEYKTHLELYNHIKTFIRIYLSEENTKEIHIKLTPLEKSFLEKTARAIGTTRTALIRKLIKDLMFGLRGKSKQDTPRE